MWQRQQKKCWDINLPQEQLPFQICARMVIHLLYYRRGTGQGHPILLSKQTVPSSTDSQEQRVFSVCNNKISIQETSGKTGAAEPLENQIPV